jgi:hypothetical protein
MRAMTKSGGFQNWPFLLGALLLCAGMAGAASGTADARLAGRWQLDPQASNNFDAELQRYLTSRQQLQQREFERMRRRYAPLEAGAVPGLQDELPPEPLETQRERVEESLRPPQRLAIELQGDEVQFTADDLPPSSLPLNDKMIRVDGSGSAEIRLRPAAGGLSLSYRYLNKARRSQQFTLGPKGDTLRITLTWQERDNLKLVVSSVYRRQGV